MIPPETISPTHISSLHQATDCHCSTVKVCKDGNEWMALLRSPSWWKQWNQQNISRFVGKIHTKRGMVKQQSKTCLISSSLCGIKHKTQQDISLTVYSWNYFRDRSLCNFALRLQPHSWRFAKKYNFGQWRKFQNKSTIDHWNHIWTHGSLQPTAKKQVGVPVYIVYMYIYIYTYNIYVGFSKNKYVFRVYPHPGFNEQGNLESHMYKTLSIKDGELVKGIWDNEHLQVPNKTKGFNEPNIKWFSWIMLVGPRNPVTNNHLTCFTNPVNKKK